MNYSYSDTRLRFRQLAPTISDYCSHCKLVFDTLIEELELKNRVRPDRESRTFTTDYDSVRQILRIGKKRYYETLEWLDKHEFIQYVRGNRYQDGYIQILHLAELPAQSFKVLPRTQTEPRQNLDETQTEPRRNSDETQSQNPPPYPPIEVINNTLPTDSMVSQPDFFKPKNIVLSDEEEANLIGTYGKALTAQMLLLVSAYKAKQGGMLRMSDFDNCLKWAAAEAKRLEKQTDSSKSPTYPYPTQPTHVTTTTRVFKEWT